MMKSYNTTADRQLVTINILSNISLSSLVICNSNLTLKSIKFSYIIHQRPYLETLFHLNKNCKTLQVTDCIFLYEATFKLDLLFSHRIFTGNMLSVNFMRSVFIGPYGDTLLDAQYISESWKELPRSKYNRLTDGVIFENCLFMNEAIVHEMWINSVNTTFTNSKFEKTLLMSRSNSVI